MMLDKIKHKTKKKTILTQGWNLDTWSNKPEMLKLTKKQSKIPDNHNFTMHIITASRQDLCIDHFANNIKEAIATTK